MSEQTIQFIDFVKQKFDGDYLEGIKEFVRIPSLSPIFDEKWQENKYLDKQCQHLINFVNSQNLIGVHIETLKDEGRTPFLIVKIDAFNTTNQVDNILMYGHLDKQPFGEGWKTDPCDPVIIDGRLYGRGSSDDGYALFTAVTAIKSCQALQKSHPKIVITIEGCEEGEIFDLLHYLKTYKHKLDNPNLVICLDSVAFTEDTITITSCLRGCINFDLSVQVAENNMHSGMAGGICPNPYLILNCLLMRIQDYKTQEVIDEYQVLEIPKNRLEDIQYMGENLQHMCKGLPMLADTKSMAYNNHKDNQVQENIELHRNNFWRSQLSVIGIEVQQYFHFIIVQYYILNYSKLMLKGLPSNINSAGNVIYKQVKFRLSMRIPPRISSKKIIESLKETLENPGDETFGAKIKFELVDGGDGFDAPDLSENLKRCLNEATYEVFQNKPLYVGCGGSIPFMEVFSELFPGCNFLLLGVGFPDSNAHSANENLRLDFCRRLTTTLGIMLSKM